RGEERRGEERGKGEVEERRRRRRGKRRGKKRRGRGEGEGGGEERRGEGEDLARISTQGRGGQAHPEGSPGVPRPVERHSLSNVSWVFPGVSYRRDMP
ncbi:hypothetical protein D4764_09G0009930, partial [Takifugu flavidus]